MLLIHSKQSIGIENSERGRGLFHQFEMKILFIYFMVIKGSMEVRISPKQTICVSGVFLSSPKQ